LVTITVEAKLIIFLVVVFQRLEGHLASDEMVGCHK
jgi:hypothetical protein